MTPRWVEHVIGLALLVGYRCRTFMYKHHAIDTDS
jgi:hypothetical protein